MNSLSLRGLRGGIGVSSLVAGLGYALHGMQQRVLLIDMCPENLLRLYFNLATREGGGWARATVDETAWNAEAWTLAPGLDLLPYGQLFPDEQERLEQRLQRAPQLWPQRLAALAGQYDWIIFDMPQRLPGHATAAHLDLQLLVGEADGACHAMMQDPARPALPVVVNRFDPASQLQRDVLLIWRKQFGDRMVSMPVHADESMREALAFKSPVGLYAPGSLAAQDVLGLATWCMAKRRVAA